MPFKKGQTTNPEGRNQHSPGGSKKRGNPRPVPQLLRDMRHVYRNPEEADTTQGQRALRTMFKENPKEFISRLSQEERAFAAVKVPASKEAVEGREAPDEGIERVEVLIDRLLGEWEHEQEESNVDH